MTETRFLAACVQMTSRRDVPANLAKAAELCGQARQRGAGLALLPENFAFMGETEEEKLPFAEVLGSGPIQTAVAEIAARNRMWLIAGGMGERAQDSSQVYNTLVAFAPDGHLAAHYRKIHLFDVNTPGGGQARESGIVAAGDTPRVLETPWGKVGLSICYDLRFPELYRALVNLGARLLVVPAAFLVHTGKDHWHPLLRARAIENEAYVLAAGQVGRHHGKRVTYGHSLIVDPWGTIIAEAQDKEGVVVAEIDLGYQDAVRHQLPCLAHRRLGLAR